MENVPAVLYQQEDNVLLAFAEFFFSLGFLWLVLCCAICGRFSGCNIAPLPRLVLRGLANPFLAKGGNFLREIILANSQKLRRLVDVGGTDAGIVYHRDAQGNLVYHLALFVRVSAGDICRKCEVLVDDEVFLGFIEEVLKLFLGMLAGERVRVVVVRNKHHFHVHSFLEEHVDAFQGGIDTGLVPVVDYGNLLCEPLEQQDLFFSKGGSAACDYVFYSRLMHRNHVCIAFYQVAVLALRYGVTSLIKTVQHSFFLVDLALGRVHVLYRALFCRKNTPAKGHDLAVYGADREHHPLVELV